MGIETSFIKNLFTKKKEDINSDKDENPEEIDTDILTDEQKRNVLTEEQKINKMIEKGRILRENKERKALDDFNQWRRP